MTRRVVATIPAWGEHAQRLEIWRPDGTVAPAFRPRRKSGPKTKPVQDKITQKLAEKGPAPLGMSIADQAKRLDVTKRSLERYLAVTKSAKICPSEMLSDISGESRDI
jgi:hypothetical protein